MRPAESPRRAQVAAAASFVFLTLILSAISRTNAMKGHLSHEEQAKAPLKHHQAMYSMREPPEVGPRCHHSSPQFEHHYSPQPIEHHQSHQAHRQEPIMAQGLKQAPTNDDHNKQHSSWPGIKENSPLMKMGISERIIWPLMKMVNKQMEHRGEEKRPSEAPLTKGKLQSSGLDSMYELINHRFKIENDFDDDDDHHEIYRANDDDNDDDDLRQNHLDNQQAQRENWRTWSNAISYFPSGQEQMRRHWRPDAAREKVQPQQVVQVSKQEPAARQRETTAPAKQQQEATKQEAPVVMVVKAEGKHDDGSVTELDQQNQVNHLDKIATMQADLSDQGLKLRAAVQTNQAGFEAQEEAMKKAAETNRVSPFMNERARDSLLKAAGIARNLAAAGSNYSARAESGGWQATSTNSTPTLVESSFANERSAEQAPGFTSNRDNVRQLYSPADQIRRIEASNQRNSSGESQEAPMALVFLGQGDLQRIEGNARLQARLSCQFGDEQAAPDSNLTIWDVEWSKFLGPYNVEQREPPPFDCADQQSSCELRTVKTDVTTTVHPRPALQEYSSSVAPSYALTLHQVQEDQYGVYRCSAKRRLNGGQVELVYRVIPLEA